jgi:hypothetical protein
LTPLTIDFEQPWKDRCNPSPDFIWAAVALVAVTAVMLSTIILDNPRVIIYVRIMGIQAATSYSKSQVQQTYSE